MPCECDVSVELGFASACRRDISGQSGHCSDEAEALRFSDAT